MLGSTLFIGELTYSVNTPDSYIWRDQYFLKRKGPYFHLDYAGKIKLQAPSEDKTKTISPPHASMERTLTAMQADISSAHFRGCSRYWA